MRSIKVSEAKVGSKVCVEFIVENLNTILCFIFVFLSYMFIIHRYLINSGSTYYSVQKLLQFHLLSKDHVTSN
jgi:hypothetical protein